MGLAQVRPMAIIYPVIKENTAQSVIFAMRKLKSRRFNHEISRVRFMQEYDKLRTALNATEEYRALRRKVIARAKGKCEKCHSVAGDQMCHRIAVAFRPDLALDIRNVYWGCERCHSLDHIEKRTTP